MLTLLKNRVMTCKTLRILHHTGWKSGYENGGPKEDHGRIFIKKVEMQARLFAEEWQKKSGKRK